MKYLILICLIILIFLPFSRCSSEEVRIDTITQKEYRWIFKDSILKEIDTLAFSDIRENDVNVHFRYKGDYINMEPAYLISVWHFKNQRKFELKNVKFDCCRDLFSIDLEGYFIYNLDSKIEQYVDQKDDFGNGLDVVLDENSSIDTIFSGHDYTGFLGHSRKYAVDSKIKKNMIVYTNELTNDKVLFCVYQKGENVFLIKVVSEKEFDQDFMKIFSFYRN